MQSTKYMNDHRGAMPQGVLLSFRQCKKYLEERSSDFAVDEQTRKQIVDLLQITSEEITKELRTESSTTRGDGENRDSLADIRVRYGSDDESSSEAKELRTESSMTTGDGENRDSLADICVRYGSNDESSSEASTVERGIADCVTGRVNAIVYEDEREGADERDAHDAVPYLEGNDGGGFDINVGSDAARVNPAEGSDETPVEPMQVDGPEGDTTPADAMQVDAPDDGGASAAKPKQPTRRSGRARRRVDSFVAHPSIQGVECDGGDKEFIADASSIEYGDAGEGISLRHNEQERKKVANVRKQQPKPTKRRKAPVKATLVAPRKDKKRAPSMKSKAENGREHAVEMDEERRAPSKSTKDTCRHER